MSDLLQEIYGINLQLEHLEDQRVEFLWRELVQNAVHDPQRLLVAFNVLALYIAVLWLGQGLNLDVQRLIALSAAPTAATTPTAATLIPATTLLLLELLLLLLLLLTLARASTSHPPASITATGAGTTAATTTTSCVATTPGPDDDTTTITSWALQQIQRIRSHDGFDVGQVLRRFRVNLRREVGVSVIGRYLCV
jgi:hypothetical protein